MLVSLTRRAPSSTLFPYTTLFRSSEHHRGSTPDVSTTGSPTTSHRTARFNPCHRTATDKRESGPATNPCASQSCRSHPVRSEEHTSELQSQSNLVCRLLLEKKNHS